MRRPIRRLPRLLFRGTAALGLLGLALVALDCSNDAKGVDACRTIEQHRCRIAKGCADSGIETDADVKVCELFYEDQCLYGVANDSTVPDKPSVSACIAALDEAAACRDETLAECSAPPAVKDPEKRADQTGCDLILVPHALEGCAFLRETEEEGDGGDGGAGGDVGGAGGAAGGAGGSGGAGGAGGS